MVTTPTVNVVEMACLLTGVVGEVVLVVELIVDVVVVEVVVLVVDVVDVVVVEVVVELVEIAEVGYGKWKYDATHCWIDGSGLGKPMKFAY